ncbi:MAG: thiamine diphosphokinase [Candidatus Kapaibacterium sp.]
MRISFHTLICLNGELPGREFFAEHFGAAFRERGGRIIAADGAAAALCALDVRPHVIVGDMDSLAVDHPLAGQTEITVLRSAEQDTNDFEKIFLLSAPQPHERVCICGFHGGDLEHTLNNWSVLMRYARRHPLYVYDKGRLAVAIHDRLDVEVQPEEIISLIPQPHARLSTEGLRWALDNEQLRLGEREGARNRATAHRVSITVHEGAVLVFFDASGSTGSAATA